jgi:hypothetical protein
LITIGEIDEEFEKKNEVLQPKTKKIKLFGKVFDVPL